MLKSTERRVVRFLAGNPGRHTAAIIGQSVGVQAIVHTLRKLMHQGLLEKYPDGRYELKKLNEQHAPAE